MGSKRPAQDKDGDHGESSSKKQRYTASSLNPSGRQSGAVDQSYGQRCAFGNLDSATIPNDEDLEWEDETDALAYLKSVRTEADKIPHVLVAQKAGPQLPTTLGSDADGAVDRSIYADGRGDFRGYYQDGAYIAGPETYEAGGEEDYDDWEEDADEGGYSEHGDAEYEKGYSDDGSSFDGPFNSSSAEIHEAYYLALMNQYGALRKLLHTEPPEDLVQTLTNENPTYVGKFGASSGTFRQWSRIVFSTNPLPAQVASMHKDSVIRLLRIILGGKFLRKGRELHERTSLWVWALLARLPNKGELDYQEIGWIRELGKRAVLLMLSLAEAAVLREQYGVGDGNDSEIGAEIDVEENSDDDTNEANNTHTTQLKGNLPSQSGDYTSEPRNSSNTAQESGQKSAEPDDEPPSESDVEMQIESDVEDGEVSGDPQPQVETSADVEAAKARLLAQLGGESYEDTSLPRPQSNSTLTSSPQLAETMTVDVEADQRTKAQVNIRTTLNMILTVAGEFYGQRDLLEFRDPFGYTIEE